MLKKIQSKKGKNKLDRPCKVNWTNIFLIQCAILDFDRKDVKTMRKKTMDMGQLQEADAPLIMQFLFIRAQYAVCIWMVQIKLPPLCRLALVNLAKTLSENLETTIKQTSGQLTNLTSQTNKLNQGELVYNLKLKISCKFFIQCHFFVSYVGCITV